MVPVADAVAIVIDVELRDVQDPLGEQIPVAPPPLRIVPVLWLLPWGAEDQVRQGTLGNASEPSVSGA